MTNHAIERAKERYKLDLTFEDIDEIVKIASSGNVKEIKRLDHIGRKNESQKTFRFRYNGKLIEPVIKNMDITHTMPTIVTFLATGKCLSFRKYVVSKTCKDFIGKQNRLNKGKRR